jgi:ABC-type transporter Mla maintaining outer membrane lipid asymmetry ATPase subunit MlaF
MVLNEGHIIAQGTVRELADSKDEVVKQFMSEV